MTANAIAAIDAGAAERLAALHAECFDDPWDAPAIARLLAMPGAFAYSVPAPGIDDGHFDGFVLARMGGDEAEILTICVRPAARRAGQGRRLLEAAAAHAAAGGATALFLEVAEDNAPALRLYERLGFHAVGTRPAYYSRGERRVAALTLRLDLPPVINP